MAPSTILDPYFRVEVISAMSNPQQVVYAAMHQDYSEGFVFDERDKWPDEKRSGELCVKRLLAGERGHYGPIEHTAIVFNCGWFPHSVLQQARTHRVGVSFDVQSMRYTGSRIVEAAEGRIDLEEVFYLRPVGTYTDRKGRSTNTPGINAKPDLGVVPRGRPALRATDRSRLCRGTRQGDLALRLPSTLRGQFQPSVRIALHGFAQQAGCAA
jgi:hypothetical protein